MKIIKIVLIIIMIYISAGRLSAHQISVQIGDKQYQLTGGKYLMSSNKFKIIDFWATWCGPCISGFTDLAELQIKYQKK